MLQPTGLDIISWSRLDHITLLAGCATRDMDIEKRALMVASSGVGKVKVVV